MTRILFVCLGNICRSPMAESIMKDLVSKAGLSEQFEIASAATSAWEIGNPVYPPARQKLAEHGIDCNGKTARQMTRLDYARYDHLIGMDESNLCDILRLVGGDPQHKISIRNKKRQLRCFLQHSCRIFVLGVRCTYYTNPPIHLLHHTAL